MKPLTHNTSAQQTTHATFFARAQQLHPAYDYTHTVLLSMHRPIEVHCPTHGAFTTLPRQHVGRARASCPTCARPTRAQKPTPLVTIEQLHRLQNQLRVYTNHTTNLSQQIADAEKTLAQYTNPKELPHDDNY